MDALIVGRDEAETIEITMHVLGVDEQEAREIIARERGEIDGDVEVADSAASEISAG